MADRKLSSLTAISAVLAGTLFYAVDGGLPYKATAAQMAASVAFSNTYVPYSGANADLDIGSHQYRGAAGSASAPTYSFTGDPNTGIFSSAADSVSAAAGGAEVWRAYSSGVMNVSNKLTVGVGLGSGIGTASFVASTAALGASGIAAIFQGTTAQSAALTEWRNVSATVLASISAVGYLGVGVAALNPIHVVAANNIVPVLINGQTSSGRNTSIRLQTQNANGLGTATGIEFGGQNAAKLGAMYGEYDASGANGFLSWYTGVANTLTEGMRLTSARRLGVRTTAPGAVVDIRSADDYATTPYVLALHAPSQSPYIAAFFNDTFSTTDPIAAYFGYDSGRFNFGSFGGDLELGAGGSAALGSTPRQRIFSATGNITIGAATDIARLAVVGSSASARVLVLRAFTAQSANIFEAQDVSANIVASISAVGNVLGNSFLSNTFQTGNATLPLDIRGGTNLGAAGINSVRINPTQFCTAISGTAVAFGINANHNFSPTSGNAAYRPFDIAYTINTSGSVSGSVVTGIYLNATETSLTGVTHELMNLGTGGGSFLSALLVTKSRITLGSGMEGGGFYFTNDQCYIQRDTDVMSTRTKGGSATGRDSTLGWLYKYNNASTITSGVGSYATYMDSFVPTTGNAVYNVLRIASILNQTAGGTGITRGIHVDVTATNLVDYRAIETSNNTGYAIYTAGTAASRFGGTLTTVAAFSALTVKATQVAGFISSDGSTGATGVATAVNTLTIKDGIITAIV